MSRIGPLRFLLAVIAPAVAIAPRLAFSPSLEQKRSTFTLPFPAVIQAVGLKERRRTMAILPAISAATPLGRFRRMALLAAFVHVVAAPVWAQTAFSQDLKRLSLEELMRVEVSTVLRVPEPTSAVPAAVFVITQDDIRRSGATSLPEICWRMHLSGKDTRRTRRQSVPFHSRSANRDGFAPTPVTAF
jgi:hypothetical protein